MKTKAASTTSNIYRVAHDLSHREAIADSTPSMTSDQPDFGNPDAWLDSADLIGYAFRLPLDQLTTIIHNLLEAGRMGDEPLGVKDLLRR